MVTGQQREAGSGPQPACDAILILCQAGQAGRVATGDFPATRVPLGYVLGSSNLALITSRDGESTAALGTLFWCLTPSQ